MSKTPILIRKTRIFYPKSDFQSIFGRKPVRNTSFHEYLFNIFQFWRHLVVWIAKKAIFVSSMMCFMKIVNTNRIRLISEIVNFHEFPILKFVKRNEKPLEVRPRNCHFDTKIAILCPPSSRYPAFGKRQTQNVLEEKSKISLFYQIQRNKCILMRNNCND